MFGYPPPRVAGRTWIEIDRDGKFVTFRCRACRKLATAAIGDNPTACVCEGKR